MQPDTPIPAPAPRIRMVGDQDRDAKDIPYEFGNRRARRLANRKINAAARAARALALKQK